MRNLSLISDTVCDIDVQSSAIPQHPRSARLCSDSDTGNVYIADVAQGTVCCITSNNQVLWTENLMQSSGDCLDSDSCIADIAFLQENEALCVSSSSGQLLLVSSPTDVQEIGRLEEGIACSAWSPDQEFLAICTTARQLTIMSKDWEVLAEESLDATLEPIEDPDRSPGVDLQIGGASIIWSGDGKYFATVCSSSAEGNEACNLKVWDREGCELHAVGAAPQGLHCVLAWQPNGRHLYAAHTLAEHHRVVLYETNGLEHGGFDVPTSGTLTQLSWSSDSELLAVVLSEAPAHNSKGHKDIVQIWHRSNWHWYLKQEQVYPGGRGVRVCWDEVVPLRLHICSGLTWYRQVELYMDRCVSNNGTAAVVDGNTVLINPLQRALVPPPMCAVALQFPGPVQCLAFGEHEGCEVLAGVTSSGELAVLQAKEGDLWEPTTEAELDQLEADGLHHPTLHPHLTPLDSPLGHTAIIRCAVWLSGTSLLLVGSPSLETGKTACDHRDILIRLDVSWGHLQTAAITGTSRAAGSIKLAVRAAEGGALLQMQDGSLWLFGQAGQGLTPCDPQASFPVPCPFMVPTPLVALQQLGGDAAPAVGLSDGGQLYWGSSPIQGACTSVAVRGEGPGGPFLLFTTRGSVLHTVPFALLGLQAAKPLPAKTAVPANKGVGAGKYKNLYTAMHAAMRPQGAQQARGVTTRAVEQGSRLVAAPPQGCRVVLQMPRGNLEGICPRVLVLAGIAAHLQAHEYGEAFELTSNNRVDLNVLVDYNWPDFLHHADDFVKEVQYDQDIVDLLAGLKPESVTAEGGLYAAALPPAPQLPHTDALSSFTPAADGLQAVEDLPQAKKVELVATAVRTALLAGPGGQGRSLRPILTSYAVVGELEGALATVKQVKESQLASGGNADSATTDGVDDSDDLAAPVGKSTQLTAEQGLKHLLLTVDVERLYRTALGMYDVQLAYMVVAHSQRDPGEYLMELQHLVAAPSAYLRHHAMDMHLGRFDKALQHLVAAGPEHFPKALQLARAKGLLRILLQLVGDNLDNRKEVLVVYGEVLSQRNLQEDSAVAFTAAGDLPRALESYKAAGHWQMALTLAGRLGWGEGQVRRLAAELVEALTCMQHLPAAAALAVQYLADVDNGVSLLTQAREWREALRIAYKHNREDLVSTVVAPASAEAAANAVSDVREERERVAKYLTRLKEVRHKRSAMEAALAAEDDEAQPSGRDFDDTASEASSAVSGMSAYARSTTTAATMATGASTHPASTVGGKKPYKRKQKKDKGGRIRQGSPEEERALGQHIAALAPSPKQLTETSQLTELLTLLGHESDARVLQQQLSLLLTEQQAAQQYISDNPPPEPPSHLQHHQNSQATRTQACPDAVDWKWDILRPASLSRHNIPTI